MRAALILLALLMVIAASGLLCALGVVVKESAETESDPDDKDANA